MACICNDAGGKRRIQFVAPDGQRKTMRLGKCSKTDAEKIKNRVESLLASKILGGVVSRDDAIWLAGDGVNVRSKFEQAGLVEPIEAKPPKQRTKLSVFLADYMSRHGSTKKPGTRAVWRQVIDNLNQLLPTAIYLDEVTAGHAKAFHEKLKAKGMAVSTIDKRIRFCRQFFTDAVDWELIPSNPFSKVKTTSGSAKSNVNVLAELITKQVMPVCDTTWKTILALCRFGGLRCPSEVLSLRWVDVDWENNRLAIREPKVEHHEGRGVRSCPIFAELRPYLDEAWEAARDGAEFVIDNADYRRAANSPEGWKNANLRTQFGRILERAGVPAWKRLFHSMRASRQTELEREFPLHVVCSWLGNSVRIAQKSYLLVTDDDFAKAICGAAQNAAQLDPKTAHNAAQHGPRTEQQGETFTLENTGETDVSPGFHDPNKRRGQEPNSIGVSKEKALTEPGAAQNAAHLTPDELLRAFYRMTQAEQMAVREGLNALLPG